VGSSSLFGCHRAPAVRRAHLGRFEISISSRDLDWPDQMCGTRPQARRNTRRAAWSPQSGPSASARSYVVSGRGPRGRCGTDRGRGPAPSCSCMDSRSARWLKRITARVRSVKAIFREIDNYPITLLA
jgi:hypothetical protein